MSEEKSSFAKAAEDKKYPEVVAGVIVYNEVGEILLTKCSKWGDYWQIPGGHVEWGEIEIDAARREIMEETGLKIDDIKFEGIQEAIFPEQFERKVHFTVHDYSAKLIGGKMAEKNYEMDEYVWLKPKLALKELKLNPYTKVAVERFLKNRNDNFEDLYKRALADYQNLLKQTAKEKMEFAVYANERMLKEILPVYDHFKMAIEHHNSEAADEWLTGVKHVVKQFKDVLEKIGVEEIEIKDKKFDHNLMEALTGEETDDESLDGLVAKEVKAGYKLNGKVIEPAKVIVYKLK